MKLATAYLKWNCDKLDLAKEKGVHFLKEIFLAFLFYLNVYNIYTLT